MPSLYELLQPVEERPAIFFLGHRNFDPRNVGYEPYAAESCEPVPEDIDGWCFDTNERGNSNSGHLFGTQLTEDERWDLIEYLKTL